MPSYIKRGESIFIPFKDDVSVYDSQNRPRMYKSLQAFERSFPGRVVAKESVELVEYAEVKHGRWEPVTVSSGRDSWKCSVCGRRARGNREYLPYCHCGAKMNDPYESFEFALANQGEDV